MGAIILQLIGFTILVIGNLIYNRIIQHPIISGVDEELSNKI